jgi:hypothetical protein
MLSLLCDGDEAVLPGEEGECDAAAVAAAAVAARFGGHGADAGAQALGQT